MQICKFMLCSYVRIQIRKGDSFCVKFSKELSYTRMHTPSVLLNIIELHENL
jgi:hypothetical protein